VVTGMTCGACASRIERRLNRLDGVQTTVNDAAGRAYFTALGGRDTPELIGVIKSTVYGAVLPTPPEDARAALIRSRATLAASRPPALRWPWWRSCSPWRPPSGLAASRR